MGRTDSLDKDVAIGGLKPADEQIDQGLSTAEPSGSNHKPVPAKPRAAKSNARKADAVLKAARQTPAE